MPRVTRRWAGSVWGSAFLGSVAGGATGGAVSAAVSEGDIGMGALTGAIAGGIGFAVGQLQVQIWRGPSPDWWGDDLSGFATSAGGGALGGGIGAELQGGSFAEGAAYGAIGGAIGYGIAVDLPDAIANPRADHLFLGKVVDALRVAGAFFEGAAEGLAASIDGALPGAQFRDFYGDNQTAVKFSKPVGGAAIQTLATAGVGGLAQVGIRGGASTMQIAVGTGKPFHVVYGAGGKVAHAMGGNLGG